MRFGVRVEISGTRDKGLEIRVWGSGLGVSGFGFGV